MSGFFALPKPVHEAEAPEYSDYEEDLTVVAQRSHDHLPRIPPFLHRHGDPKRRAAKSGSDPIKDNTATSRPPPIAVPVTPSLLHALDRIAVAQGQAYSSSDSSNGSVTLRDGLPDPSATGLRWDAFWKDVNAKVMSPR